MPSPDLRTGSLAADSAPTGLRDRMRHGGDLRSARRPVALFTNGIGDALLALPALRALAHAFNGRLTLLCDRRCRDLFYRELRLHHSLEIPDLRRDGERGIRTFDVERLVSRVGEADLFVSLAAWQAPSLAALVRRLSPEVVVSFYPDADIMVPPTRDLHSADLAFEVARCIDPALALEDFVGPPRLPGAAVEFARDFRHALPEWARVLVVHADTHPSKCWSGVRFARAIDEFLTDRPEFIAWIVGLPGVPIEATRHAARVVSCVGLPLGETMALIGQADLFLGIDSCMLHAADLFRIPGVGLFGATSAAEWGFRFAPHRHVQGTGSLAAVSAGAVVASLHELLGGIQ